VLLMSWVLKEEILLELSTQPERKAWEEEGAFEVFHEVWEKLRPEHREKTRIGALGFKPIQGSELLQAWMVPIEGHPKILGFKNSLQILSREGSVLFEGTWGDVPLEMVKQQTEFFIWLPYRHGSKPEKLDWKTKLLGAFRYVKNRKKKP